MEAPPYLIFGVDQTLTGCTLPEKYLFRKPMASSSQYVAAGSLSADPFVLTCIFVIARATATSAGKQSSEAPRPRIGGFVLNVLQPE